jgi:hypothetical protein
MGPACKPGPSCWMTLFCILMRRAANGQPATYNNMAYIDALCHGIPIASHILGDHRAHPRADHDRAVEAKHNPALVAFGLSIERL